MPIWANYDIEPFSGSALYQVTSMPIDALPSGSTSLFVQLNLPFIQNIAADVPAMTVFFSIDKDPLSPAPVTPGSWGVGFSHFGLGSVHGVLDVSLAPNDYYTLTWADVINFGDHSLDPLTPSSLRVWIDSVSVISPQESALLAIPILVAAPIL